MAVSLTDVNTGGTIIVDKANVVSYYEIEGIFRQVNMNDGTIHDVSESFDDLISAIGGGGGGSLPF